MGKIIDRVRARQDLIEARKRMESLFDEMREKIRMLPEYAAAKRLAGEVMLMVNKGDEVQH